MRWASAAALAAALAVGGCGGGSSSSSSSSLSTVKSPKRETRSGPTTTTTSSKPPESTQSDSTQATHHALPTKASPTQIVRVALTSAEPAVCTLYTPALLDKSFGGVQGCRASVRSGGRADSVEIVKSSTKGHRALVVAVPHGGPSSAQKLQMTLVREGGDWRLQSIKSNVPVGP